MNARKSLSKGSGRRFGDYWASQFEATYQQRQDAACAFSARLMPLLNEFSSQGLSRRAMVVHLNDLGIKAPKGGAWSLGQVQRLAISTKCYGLNIDLTKAG